MTRGSEPGTGISRAHSSGTRSKPEARAATAGNSASRSSVSVKMQLTTSAGAQVVALHDLAHERLGRAEDLAGLVGVDGGGAAQGEQAHGRRC